MPRLFYQECVLTRKAEAALPGANALPNLQVPHRYTCAHKASLDQHFGDRAVRPPGSIGIQWAAITASCL